jgi:hypothetical protein
MVAMLWAGAGITLAYLAYALNKNSAPQQKSIAEQTRILDVPEDMLSCRPVAKEVRIKSVDPTQDSNWWDQKIQGHQSRVSRRKSLEPDQLLLSDTDQSLR